MLPLYSIVLKQSGGMCVLACCAWCKVTFCALYSVIVRAQSSNESTRYVFYGLRHHSMLNLLSQCTVCFIIRFLTSKLLPALIDGWNRAYWRSWQLLNSLHSKGSFRWKLMSGYDGQMKNSHMNRHSRVYYVKHLELLHWSQYAVEVE